MADEYRILTVPSSSEIEVKRSRFLAELRPVSSEEEARAFLEEIRTRHRDARHHCSAYRIGAPGKVKERANDDGEPQGTAGKPMLELLRGASLYDVCVIVTRYFGGTLLGTGGLVRAYADATKEALSAAETAVLSEGVQALVRCDYSLSGKLRYFAESSGFYPAAQRFTDCCELSYLMPKEAYPDFAKKVLDFSAGAAEAVCEATVLYYGENAPKVYKVL